MTYQSAKPYFYGTGRRKKSVARVRLYPGTGVITVNGKSIDEYFDWFCYDQVAIPAEDHAEELQKNAQKREDFYQAFHAGIFRGRSGGNEVKTDDEQGIGRSDIDYRDKRNRRAMIIETKCSDSKKDMERDCEKAIVQIKEKEYARDLDGYKKVMSDGISVYKKQAMVKLDRSE